MNKVLEEIKKTAKKQPLSCARAKNNEPPDALIAEIILKMLTTNILMALNTVFYIVVNKVERLTSKKNSHFGGLFET